MTTKREIIKAYKEALNSYREAKKKADEAYREYVITEQKCSDADFERLNAKAVLEKIESEYKKLTKQKKPAKNEV